MQPDDPKSAEFHYDVDSRQMDQFTIWVSSTGRAGNVLRTLQAKVTIAGSQRYLYVTDFEDADPENTVIYPSGAGPRRLRQERDHQGEVLVAAALNERARSGSPDCTEIQFITADVLDGPVHFNDTPLINGNATFRQGFTTYATGLPEVRDDHATAAKAAGCYRGSGTPSLSAKGARWANVNLLPDTTGDIVNKPGCQFTGDTRIRFNSNGTMDVWNTSRSGTTIGFVRQPGGRATAARTAGPRPTTSPQPARSTRRPSRPSPCPTAW